MYRPEPQEAFSADELMTYETKTLTRLENDMMEENKTYGFLYQGRKDWKPEYRKVTVEEIDRTSILGKVESGEWRRFRFDSMKSSVEEIK